MPEKEESADLQKELKKAAEEGENCSCCKGGGSRVGSYQRDKKKILHGLRRVEGQIRGIERMVEEERYCVDVLNQIAAARMALARLAMIILEDHTRGCVAGALQEKDGREGIIEELMGIMHKFM